MGIQRRVSRLASAALGPIAKSGFKNRPNVKAAVEFEGVVAGYDDVNVLQDVTFTITAGEIVGVLGPNGAGKTTLLRCIAGLCVPKRGTVRLFGTEVRRLSSTERARQVAVVPQQIEVPMAFTVEEIVMIGRTATLSRWHPPTDSDRTLVERAMVFTDVAAIRHRLFNELSGGEQQRVMVAMALAQEPRLILMDEATSHLDMNHRLELMQIIERLNRERGLTVVFISHDINLAGEFCQRLLLLDHGRLVGNGPPREILTENTLRQVYHCDVRVEQSANGAITVLPVRRLDTDACGRGLRIHAIAGGGCGEEVLRRLRLCGYTVTCGVLNQGDSDATAAAVLEVETVLEKPFSPVSAAALEMARQMVMAADAVVIVGMPVGPGNLANLELAAMALMAGKPVLIRDGIAERDYTPNRRATAEAERLIHNGALVWRDLPELLHRLPRNPQ